MWTKALPWNGLISGSDVPVQGSFRLTQTARQESSRGWLSKLGSLFGSL